MQVGEQRGHLLVGEPASEARHHAFARQNDADHFNVGGGCPARQFGVLEHAV